MDTYCITRENPKFWVSSNGKSDETTLGNKEDPFKEIQDVFEFMNELVVYTYENYMNRT